MSETIDELQWVAFLREYTDRNKGRPTRLGVFEVSHGAAHDYWIEDGLPLVALDAHRRYGRSRVDVYVGDYTHSIEGANKLVHVSGDEKDGLDILDSEGNTTVIRFENWQRKDED